jgi:serine-type D-Ala-D-Ala carboxypeptidase/endopeptidase (penicillin-binding protein 4)
MQENKNSRFISDFLRRPPTRLILALPAFVFFSVSPRAADTVSLPPAQPAAPAAPAQHRPVEALLAKNKYPLSKVSIAIRDLAQDTLRESLNPDSQVNPASVCKLVTAAMAFDRLGTVYSFKTSVYMDSGFDPGTGECRGNLYIRGGGDPSLVVERLWLFVQHLASMGLKTIDRDIVLDDSFFDSTAIGPGFTEDSSDNPYMAPVNALTSNFNCVSVWVRPGASQGAPVFAALLPKAKIVTLSSSAKTSAPGGRTEYAVSARKSGDATNVFVSGFLPADGKQVVEYTKVWQSRDYFASVLQGLLTDNKITLKGGFRHGPVPGPVRQMPPFYVFGSIPLPDIVTDMFKYSSNFAAEMIFKTLSAEKDSTAGSWEKSSALAGAWWREKGLAAHPFMPKIKNGSGMGDCDRMSCRQIVDLLAFVNKSKQYFPEYLDALPNAGIDGTLKSRFKNSRFRGIVRAKTGTLNDYGVHSIAGYVMLPAKTYAFAIVFNGLSSRSQGNQLEMQEKILDQIVPEK